MLEIGPNSLTGCHNVFAPLTQPKEDEQLLKNDISAAIAEFNSGNIEVASRIIGSIGDDLRQDSTGLQLKALMSRDAVDVLPLLQFAAFDVHSQKGFAPRQK